MDLLRLFADNLLPVFLAAGAGYLLAATLRTDPRPLSHVSFNVFAPCFIFDIIVKSRVPAADLARMTGFAALALFAVAALAWLAARALGLTRTQTSALVLCGLLPNAGNYGLSANLLAFGQPGLAQASLFFITSSVLTYTAGVLIASLGRAGVGAALAGLARVPTVWGVAVAFAMPGLGWSLPGPVDRAVSLLAQATIPAFLVILGMQMHAAGASGPMRPLLAASGLRLLGGAAAGLLLAPLFGLEGAARQAGILQSAMPTAVITTILATEYDVEPRLVASVVFLTTVLSPLTLTPLLALLR